MYDVPDWEEIYGYDPNDVDRFNFSNRMNPKIITGPKFNRWLVMAHFDDGSSKQLKLGLRIVDDEMYWFRPMPKTPNPESKLTIFTNHQEAFQAQEAAKERYPELSISIKGFTVKE